MKPSSHHGHIHDPILQFSNIVGLLHALFFLLYSCAFFLLSLQFLTALHFSPFQCHHPLLCVFLRAGTHAEATERSTGWPVVSFICVFVEGPVTGLEMANQAGLASQQAPGGTGQSPPPQCQDYKQALV